MKYNTLDEWLAWQTTLHAREIELGLDRIETVASKLNLLECPFPVITVAGTNGKGSTVAMLSAILHHAGYKVGTYTSPHIVHYNERIRIGLRCVQDEQLCRSFEKINDARGDISLSFFEFATLTAIDIFHENQVEVAILEVGLGGRLDATNIIDNDLAFVTSIGLDHTEWLGDNRESIGYEKSGIFRADTPAICGAVDAPSSIEKTAKKVNANLFQLGNDYSYKVAKSSWSFFANDYELHGLPLPNLSGAVQIRNAASVVMGLYCLREKLPLSTDAIETGLREVTLEGRFQRIVKDCEIILDVAHNFESAKILSENLMALPKPQRTIAVFAILSDKDVDGIISLLHSHIDDWYISEVDSPRRMEVDHVEQSLMRQSSDTSVKVFQSVEQAYSQAQMEASEGDRIIVFGSIFTVSEVLASES
ncbi:MAG: bifunctional tetrahydrofolate synthase/dihydrofolate synthase [Gammaproteobacteria bacterium]